MKKGLLNFKILIILFFIHLCTRPCHAAAAFRKTIVNKNGALIHKACKASQDYDLCLSILNGDRRSATADVPGLAIIVLEHAITKANETIDLIKKLDAKTTDKPLKLCFGGCIDPEYNEFISHCLVAISQVKQNQSIDAQANIGGATENESSCEDCFSETIPPRKSPITSVNQLNLRLLNIAAYLYGDTKN